MSGRVVLVTDSTAYLPPRVADELGITVVPLTVVMGGKSFAEGVDIGGDEVARALQSDATVTTSRPSPAAFVEVYQRLQAEGATAIVSVHLSGDISGTVDAARLAAAEVSSVGLAVDVVDSRSLGMGMGFGVITAARLAAAGSTPREAAEAALRRSLNSSIFMYVDTLEYLRRGGRIGAAQAWLGSALTIKPLLNLVDGRLEPLDRVRTTERAIVRLVEAATADAGTDLVDVAVHHLAAADRAENVAQRLRGQIHALNDLSVSEVGAVIGAHVGPGSVGVVVSPVDPG
ncbi:MAG TPA: DegV family protein [Kineosporiaceae bacterium]|nr:DegV family protein [Kineosporiaceae bacterium]